MLHVSQCNFVGGTDGVTGSNRPPNCSSAGLTGELRIICHQNERNEKEPGQNLQPALAIVHKLVFIISAENDCCVIVRFLEGLMYLFDFFFFFPKVNLIAFVDNINIGPLQEVYTRLFSIPLTKSYMWKQLL